MCRNLTGEGCGYTPSDSVQKRKSSDSGNTGKFDNLGHYAKSYHNTDYMVLSILNEKIFVLMKIVIMNYLSICFSYIINSAMSETMLFFVSDHQRKKHKDDSLFKKPLNTVNLLIVLKPT